MMAILFPPTLAQTLLTVLADHQGRDAAIGRGALVAAVARQGFRVHERQVRECIKRLRRNGHLICAMPGTDGGYYLAASREEFQDFDRAEFGAKIADMNETRQSMLKAARLQFGEFAVQARLL